MTGVPSDQGGCPRTPEKHFDPGCIFESLGEFTKNTPRESIKSDSLVVRLGHLNFKPIFQNVAPPLPS